MSEKKFHLTFTFDQLTQLRSMAMAMTAATLRARLDKLETVDDPEQEVGVLSEINRQVRAEGEFHTEMLKLIGVMLDNGGVAVHIDVSRQIYTWLHAVAYSKYFEPNAPDIIEQFDAGEREEYAQAIMGLRQAIDEAKPAQVEESPAPEPEQHIQLTMRAPPGAQ